MIKDIHFIWVWRFMRPLNQVVMDHNIKEIETHMPDWSISIWTDDIRNIPDRMRKYVKLVDNDYLLKMKTHPAVLDSTSGEFRVPHYVDMIRLKVLMDNGGIYLDSDDFMIGDISSLIDPNNLNIIQESRRWMTNSFMYSPEVRHPDVVGIYNYIMDGMVRYATWAATGPIAVTQYYYDKASDVIKADAGINKDSQGWPLLKDVMDRGLYPGLTIIPDTIYPIKWQRFLKIIATGLTFDIEEYRKKGFKMLALYGSVDTRGDQFPEDGVDVKFNTNSGLHTIRLGHK